MAKSTIWLWVGEDKFQKPIKSSQRITVQEVGKINNWVKNKSYY